jgi:hypothetical protein
MKGAPVGIKAFRIGANIVAFSIRGKERWC